MKAAVDQGVRRDKGILPYSFHIVPEAAFGDTQYDGELVFGNGEDGTVTITSDTSLTEDMYYSNLTIAEGATLNPNGFRVFVKNKLTLNGDLGIKESAGAITSGTLEGTVAAGQNVVDGLGGPGEPDGMVSGYTFTGVGAMTGSTTVSPSDFYNLRNAVNGYRQRGSDFIRVKGGAGGGVGADGVNGTGADGTYSANATTVGAAGGKGSTGSGGSGGAGARGGGVVMVSAREVEGSGGVYSEGGSGVAGATGTDGADAPVFNQDAYTTVVPGVPYTVDPAPYVSAEGYWTNPDPSACSEVAATCCVGAVAAGCNTYETQSGSQCGGTTGCTGGVAAECNGWAQVPCNCVPQTSGCGIIDGGQTCTPIYNVLAESGSWYGVPQPCIDTTVHVEFYHPFTGEFIEFDTIVCEAQPDHQEWRIDWSVPAGTFIIGEDCVDNADTDLGPCGETCGSCNGACNSWTTAVPCTPQYPSCQVCTDPVLPVACSDVTSLAQCGAIPGQLSCPDPTWTDPVITDPAPYSVTPPDTNAYHPPMDFTGGAGGTGYTGQRGGRGGGGVLIMITRNAGTPDYSLNTGINGTLVALDTVNLS